MRVAELWLETVRDMRVVHRCHSRLPLAQRMGSNGKPEKVRVARSTESRVLQRTLMLV
jgi:hypothetical protein